MNYFEGKVKGTVVIIAVVMLAIGIIGGTFIAKLIEDKDTIDSAKTVNNESSTPTVTTEGGNRPSYNS